MTVYINMYHDGEQLVTNTGWGTILDATGLWYHINQGTWISKPAKMDAVGAGDWLLFPSSPASDWHHLNSIGKHCGSRYRGPLHSPNWYPTIPYSTMVGHSTEISKYTLKQWQIEKQYHITSKLSYFFYPHG